MQSFGVFFIGSKSPALTILLRSMIAPQRDEPWIRRGGPLALPYRGAVVNGKRIEASNAFGRRRRGGGGGGAAC